MTPSRHLAPIRAAVLAALLFAAPALAQPPPGASEGGETSAAAPSPADGLPAEADPAPAASAQPGDPWLHPPVAEPEPVREEDTTLSDYRMPFGALADRAIGRTSRRVRFDWRRGLVQVGAIGGLPAWLNNYDSIRAGGFVRIPKGHLLLELGISYVWVSGSESTEQLALTPYRQPGRPDRFVLDIGAGLAVAEGVVTPLPGFLPAAQLVLNAHAQLRYNVYPGGFEDLDWKEFARALVAGTLSDHEVENLEDERLDGMKVDRARYGLMLGLGNDVYFQSGLFFTYRLMAAVPLLAFMTDTELYWGLELSLALGVAF